MAKSDFDERFDELVVAVMSYDEEYHDYDLYDNYDSSAGTFEEWHEAYVRSTLLETPEDITADIELVMSDMDEQNDVEEIIRLGQIVTDIEQFMEDFKAERHAAEMRAKWADRLQGMVDEPSNEVDGFEF